MSIIIKDRWFLLSELAEMVEAQHPKLSAMKRPAKRKYMWRLVKRIEVRDGERYTKRVGRALLVSRRALESLLPRDQRVLSDIESAVSRMAQQQRELYRRVNSHGARLRVLEKKQGLTQKYLAEVAEAERDLIGT